MSSPAASVEALNKRKVKKMNEIETVTGFEFTTLENGRVLLEFYGDSGKTLNSQIFGAGLLKDIALTAFATQLAMGKNKEAAIKFLNAVAKQELLLKRRDAK